MPACIPRVFLAVALGSLAGCGTPSQPHRLEVYPVSGTLLVNGHPATPQQEQYLASYGFNPGAWRMNGWGITQDVAHADFVPEARLPQCHYVLGVPLDCDKLLIASR